MSSTTMDSAGNSICSSSSSNSSSETGEVNVSMDGCSYDPSNADSVVGSTSSLLDGNGTPSSTTAAGPSRHAPVAVNKLGGGFINGRPLPDSMRHRIIEMTNQGLRPCEISRKLLVSHGCISKIIHRYAKTGSTRPGPSGTSRTRANTSAIMQAIARYRTFEPGLGVVNVRQRLIADGICSDQNMPAWINRLVSKNDKSPVNSNPSPPFFASNYPTTFFDVGSPVPGQCPVSPSSHHYNAVHQHSPVFLHHQSQHHWQVDRHPQPPLLQLQPCSPYYHSTALPARLPPQIAVSPVGAATTPASPITSPTADYYYDGQLALCRQSREQPRTSFCKYRQTIKSMADISDMIRLTCNRWPYSTDVTDDVITPPADDFSSYVSSLSQSAPLAMSASVSPFPVPGKLSSWSTMSCPDKPGIYGNVHVSEPATPSP